MESKNTNKAYISFLESINSTMDIETLYKDSFDFLNSYFYPSRIQIWEHINKTNEMSVSFEFISHSDSSPSMIKFRVPPLPERVKKTALEATIWEYNNIENEILNSFKINSLIGVEFKPKEQNKGILLLASQKKNFPIENNNISFLINSIKQLEIASYKIFKLQRSVDEAKRLYDQNNKLRELDRTRSNFINSISHEFRTPLASILGFSKMLSTKNNLSEQIKEIVCQIQQAANRLSSLISDFLQINKTSSEGWSSHLEPCDLGETIKRSVEEFSSLYKSHNISYKITNNYPILKTDEKLIRQILDNLISNAIKYSPSGGGINITLEVSDNEQEIKVTIADEGIGIDKEELPKIFNRLYRSTNSNVQKISGTGLGLAICKEIISVLNGKIEVESEPNKGSKFTFILPIN